MDFSEKWGKDVEDATKLALADLQLTINDVDVIVLEAPSKGFLGIGSKMAKVRVEKKKPLTQEQLREIAKAEDEERRQKARLEDARKEAARVEEAAKKEKERIANKPNVVETSSSRMNTEEKRPDSRGRDDKFAGKTRRDDRYADRPRREERKPVEMESMTEVQGSAAELFLKDITQKMGLELNIHVYEGDDAVYANIDGKDSGTIIGKRGQTLDAVQYLTSLVVNKGKEKHLRVIVNAENYREKREKTLEQLAKRLADKVNKTGKSVRLEPMNPYERKVIHATLQGSNSVTTRSEGEEPYRRVIIELK